MKTRIFRRPDKNIFLWIAASVAASASNGINPNGINTLLANGLSTFSIKDSYPVFSNGPKSLPKNLPDYPIL